MESGDFDVAQWMLCVLVITLTTEMGGRGRGAYSEMLGRASAVLKQLMIHVDTE